MLRCDIRRFHCHASANMPLCNKYEMKYTDEPAEKTGEKEESVRSSIELWRRKTDGFMCHYRMNAMTRDKQNIYSRHYQRALI